MSAILIIPAAFWVLTGVWIALEIHRAPLGDEDGMVMHYCTACAKSFSSFGSPCCPRCGRQSEL